MAKDEQVIEIPARQGVRGRLDKLCQEYTTKAHALRIAIEILNDDDRQQALEQAPKKFQQALAARGELPASGNGNRSTGVARVEELRNYLTDNPGKNTFEIAEALGWSKNNVLKWAAKIAKGTTDGTRAPMSWTLSAHGHQSRAKTKGKAWHVANIHQYLQTHPGLNTNQLAAALKMHKGLLLNYITEVATATNKDSRRGNDALIWVAKSSAPAAPDEAETRTKRSKAGRAPRLPRAERLAQIRKFLDRHPEAKTSAIANALKVNSNSNLRNMIEEIAKPVRPTTGRQAMEWVLR